MRGQNGSHGMNQDRMTQLSMVKITAQCLCGCSVPQSVPHYSHSYLALSRMRVVDRVLRCQPAIQYRHAYVSLVIEEH